MPRTGKTHSDSNPQQKQEEISIKEEEGEGRLTVQL